MLIQTYDEVQIGGMYVVGLNRIEKIWVTSKIYTDNHFKTFDAFLSGDRWTVDEAGTWILDFNTDLQNVQSPRYPSMLGIFNRPMIPNTLNRCLTTLYEAKICLMLSAPYPAHNSLTPKMLKEFDRDLKIALGVVPTTPSESFDTDEAWERAMKGI